MFKDIFAKLIQSRNVTAYKMSKDTGISESLISNWKSGRQLPKYDSINVLADYFNVSGDYLLGRETVDIKDQTNSENISEHEKKVLMAYRKNPNLQFAVDKLLGINAQYVRAIRIARSNTSSVEVVYDDFSDLDNAPETDEDL